MRTTIDHGEARKLRATVSIVTMVISPRVITRDLVVGTPVPILSRDTVLPTEGTYVFSNATEKSSSIKIYVFFGENGSKTDDVSLGRFVVQGIPSVPKGPSQIQVKLSVSIDQILSIAITDPAAIGYRSVGFIDLSKIEPPVVIEPPSRPPGFPSISSIFEDFFGDNRIRHMPVLGKDISHYLTITFDEALYGVQKHIEVLQAEMCPTCTGSGAQPGTTLVKCANCQGTGLEKKLEHGVLVSASTCPKCRGEGQIMPSPCITCQGRTWVKNSRPFTLNIPSGIDSGTQICYPNQGEPGQYGGRSGHLYTIVTVADHPLFTRIDRDIFIHLPVSASFAKEGGQLQVPGVEEGSFLLLNLPPNTQHGAAFQVYKNELYTLNAIIDTYSPYNPIALLRIQKHLQAIRKALNYMDFEIRVQR
jgi:hypothetical protein